jgi:hypothetical protein
LRGVIGVLLAAAFVATICRRVAPRVDPIARFPRG